MTDRAFSTIFAESDAAAPVVGGQAYAAQQSFILTIPATGTFIDATGDTAANGDVVHAMFPAGGTAPADPAAITPAEFALMEIVEGSESGASGVFDLSKVDLIHEANTTNRTSYNVPLGMTWAEFKAKYSKIAVGIAFNNFDADRKSAEYWVEDLAQGNEVEVMARINSGSNGYYVYFVVPSDAASSLSFQRAGVCEFSGAIVRGIGVLGNVVGPEDVLITNVAAAELAKTYGLEKQADGTLLMVEVAADAPLDYTISIPWGSKGNFDFNGTTPFQVARDGIYSYTWRNCQAAATQGSRTSYSAQIRTAASGGGAEVVRNYLSRDPTTANGATVTLPSASGTVALVAGQNYYIFGDRNTGGLNAGNVWTLDLSLA